MKHVKRLSLICCTLALTLQGADNQLHRYFMANYHQFGGNIPKAFSWYTQLLNNEMPPYAYKGYVTFLHSLGHYNHIYKLMPTVDPLLPNDPEIQLIFAQVLEQSGKENDSYEKVIKLSKKFPLHEEICYAAAQIFIKRDEPAQAITTIDALINSAPRKQNTFIFHYSKAIAHLAMDQKKLALDSVAKSVELQPRFDRGWLLYSLIEEQLGNVGEALRGYATYQKLSGEKGIIEQHVQRLENPKKNTLESELKSDQKAILLKALHKHASYEKPSFLIKDTLTRFALGTTIPFHS